MSETQREPVVLDALSLPESNATSYPAPYRELNRLRWNRRLSPALGLTNFGVNVTRIVPGGQSSCRHWHTRQDEFVYVLAGEAILETDAGEQIVRPGMCAGFPAGLANGHRFLNKSESDVLLLVVGDRTKGDSGHYPDVDLQVTVDAAGGFRYSTKDGKAFE